MFILKKMIKLIYLTSFGWIYYYNWSCEKSDLGYGLIDNDLFIPIYITFKCQMFKHQKIFWINL